MTSLRSTLCQHAHPWTSSAPNLPDPYFAPGGLPPYREVPALVNYGAWARVAHCLYGWFAPAAAARHLLEEFKTPTRPSSASFGLPGGERPSKDENPGHPFTTHVWGNPQSEPYVLIAPSERSGTAALARWIHALRQAEYAVVAVVPRNTSPKRSTMASTLTNAAESLCLAAHQHGPADALIGHADGAAASMIALTLGLSAQRTVLLAPHADPEAALQRFAARYGGGTKLVRRAKALLEQRMRSPLEALQAHRLCPTVGIPTLVVHDAQDNEVPWDEGERYARLLSKGELLTTSQLGHCSLLQDVDVIYDCLDFIEGRRVGLRVVSSPNLPFGTG